MKYAIITDIHILHLYGWKIFQEYKTQGKDVVLLAFPPGEAFKTRKTKEDLENYLLFWGCSRDTTIVALGGGVVTDVAGFLASTFCRGVPLILIPTTVVAMVDTSIGGKTGVNVCGVKNRIGTFYLPTETIIDEMFLSTLSEKEWWNGRVEMLKVGLVWDRDFFENFSRFSNKEAIHRARAIKEEIVAKDSFDRGIRSLLNLGHTLGHAFETLSHYAMSHGEAVAAGIVLEARISHAMGLLPQDALIKIEKRFPCVAIKFSFEKVIRLIRLDKKNRGESLRFILLEEIGKASERSVPEAVIKEVLK